jgi:RNA polymerase sigma-70 factor (ECF subfamily)
MNTDISVDIDPDEIALIQKAKSGDRTGFNQIVLLYQKQVYRFARRLLNSHDDADDVTQEVFIRLYNSISGFRGESKLSTYIYRITYNLSINHLKKYSKSLKLHTDLDDGNLASVKSDYNPEVDFEKSEKEKLVRNACNALPDKQKAIFNLRFYENLTYEEIAKITGKSLGGVKANYFHAFKKIEAKIKKSKYFI